MNVEIRRISLVTGASRGIGAETARLLAADGDHVIVNYREKRKRAQDLVHLITRSGGAATAMGADVSDENAVERSMGEVDERL
ncbi:SDR family NAD(P)-dependent oxidoreductase (plasmid) [Rhodococcus opacus]